MGRFGRWATGIGVGVVLGFAAPALAAAPAELDASFGTDGVAALTLHESTGLTFQVSDVAVGADGSTVLLGGVLRTASTDTFDPTQFDVAVAKLTPAGAADESFGSNGVARFDLGEFDLASQVELDGAGRVVFSANRLGADTLSAVVGRLTTAGALDPAFGTDGLTTFADAPLTFTHGLTVDDVGRPAVAITSGDGLQSSAGRASIVRLTVDGQLDPGFGSNGTASITDADAGAFGLTRTASGDYVVSGLVAPDGPYVAKLDDTGALVTSFGEGGITRIAAAGGFAMTVRELDDGDFVVGGRVGYRSGLLARVDASGRLDATFGVEGIRTVRSSDAGPMPVLTVEAGPSNSVVFTGSPQDGTGRATVGRVLASGAEDAGFGGDGYVHPLDGLAIQSSAGTTVSVGGDGKLVVGGTTGTDQDINAFAARFQVIPSGSPVVGGEAQRVAGIDRITTAVELSRRLFAGATEPTGRKAGAVVIAVADRFPDALVAAPYAAFEDAPLLLNPTEGLDDRVRAELSRVLADGGSVTLMGGPNALATSLEDELRTAGYSVNRIAGTDRYETSVRVAERLAATSVVLARGDHFADALAGGPAAAELGGAVLLTAGRTLPDSVVAYLDAHPDLARYAVGGDAAAAAPTAEAIAGTDRYETAALVADRFFHTPGRTVVASGEMFPDALAGGTHAALTGSPLLLSTRTSLPTSTDQALRQVRGFHRAVTIAGGTAVLTDEVLVAVRQATS